MKKITFLILGNLIVFTANAWAGKAAAEIRGTDPTSVIAGRATFEDSGKGLIIKVDVANVSSGRHGFHIHEKGSCGDKGNAAGGHFNPAGVRHGFLPQDGLAGSHAGDFGNLEVGADGKGTLKLNLPDLGVEGKKYSVVGRSVILHEKEDDFGQPTGNAGSRIACGVIEARE